MNTNSLPPRTTSLFILISGLILAWLNPVFGQTSHSAQLQWAQNQESDLAGYRVHQGTTSGQYGISKDVGLKNAYTVSNLDPSLSHYFAVTAYDTSGNESPPSLEVSRTFNSTSDPNPGTGSAILLTEDFGDGDIAGWQVMDSGTVNGPSAWAVSRKALRQSSNIHGGSTGRGTVPKPGTQVLYKKGKTWSDYSVTLSLRSEDNDALGVLVRYQDPDNFYRFSWNRQRQYRRLVKAVKGIYTVLAEDSVPYVTGQTYAVKLTVVGSQVTVAIDGVNVFTVTDRSHTSGTVGLYSWGNQGSWFDTIHAASR
jgi:hypothetical protein